MKNYRKQQALVISLNLASIIVFLLSFFFHSPLIQAIPGTLLILLPAINLSLILSTISRRQLSGWQFLLSVALASPVCLALTSFISLSLKGHFEPDSIINNYLILVTLSFLTAWLVVRFSTSFLPEWPKIDRTIVVILVSFLILQMGHFLLYRFLPEADPYRTLIDIDQAIKTGLFNDSTRRTLFEPLVLGTYSLTGIPAYWLYKVFFPLASGLMIIPFYLISSNLTKNKALIIISSLSPFLFPVISLESVITRPQLLFMISLPITIYLLQELIKSSNLKDGWWLLSLALGSTIALKFHELFAVQLMLVVLASLYFYRQTIKKYPLESAVGVLGLVTLSFPWLRDLGLTEPLTGIVERSYRILSKGNFDWWFIDNYKNVDGNQLGWPGYSWIFYYGYNLGLALPLLLLVGGIKKSFSDWATIGLALASAAIFLTIAEVLPRFGLAYLPDRAMLFFAISTAFTLPFLIINVSGRLAKLAVVVAIILSLATNWGLTWAKQGRVSPSQAEAAQFIKEKTDQGAIIIAQGGAAAWVRYFAQRQWVKIPSVVARNPNSSDSAEIFKDLADTNLQIKKFNQISSDLEESMQLQLQAYRQSETASGRGSLIEKIGALHRKHELNEQEKEVFIDQGYPETRELYLLYSTDFFDSLYGKRVWWRQQNLFDLDLSQFDTDSFELIYDQSGEKLWRIKVNR